MTCCAFLGDPKAGRFFRLRVTENPVWMASGEREGSFVVFQEIWLPSRVSLFFLCPSALSLTSFRSFLSSDWSCFPSLFSVIGRLEGCNALIRLGFISDPLLELGYGARCGGYRAKRRRQRMLAGSWPAHVLQAPRFREREECV